MSDGWKCLVCGGINPANRESCLACNMPRGMTRDSMEVCPNCGKIIPNYSNYCTNCKKAYRAFRRKNPDAYPKAETPDSIMCFAAKQNKTMVLAEPNDKAERLYLMGPGDMLPIQSELEVYYCLQIPGNEKGFVTKNSGIVVELGIENVKEPLGYVRQNFHKPNVNITIPQPDSSVEIVGALKTDDRFPIVEEREDHFKIQLSNGLQGWVHKADVVRIISPSSVLETPPSGGLSDVLLGVAGLMALGLIGGLVGDPEENKIRRGVDQALRDRGM